MKSVVIVEDDALLRESLAEFLTLNGHDITAVTDGAGLRQALQQQHFTVAVIDVGLPDCSGFDLAEEIRRDFDTKIILLTALSSVNDRVRGYHCGGHLYLTKPVDNRELSAAIFSLSGNGQPQPPSRSVTNKDTGWRLDRKNWKLIAPNHLETTLTNKEISFLRLLLTDEQNCSARNEIIAELYPRVDSYTSRALDVMVGRLRAKVVKSCGEELPLKTLYSEGYQFTVPITLIN